MLDLQSSQFKLSSVNFRQELHGEDHVRACDLKFEGVVGSDVLIGIHPELRGMLFKKDEQPDLIDQANPEAITALRFPKLGTLKYDWEGTGYKVEIDYGIGGKSNIALADCKVDGLRIDAMQGGSVRIDAMQGGSVRIDAMQGGSVRIGFRVICHPDGKHVDPLTEMLQSDVEITITPPEPTSVEELFGEDKKAA